MSILQKIGGDRNVKGGKMLEPLVLAIILPQFLSNITWSGRAAKGKDRKIALSKYGNIVTLITSICHKIDASYEPDECTKDLKYKILKYAHNKYSDDTSSSEIIS